MMSNEKRLVPIYTSAGDLEAFMVYPNIFDRAGEWIGFVTMNRDVYSVHGEYVGQLSDDPRILRNRSEKFGKPRLTPPLPPEKLRVPPGGRLAPMMSELGYDTVDVLQEEPERLPTVDAGEFREDID